MNDHMQIGSRKPSREELNQRVPQLRGFGAAYFLERVHALTSMPNSDLLARLQDPSNSIRWSAFEELSRRVNSNPGNVNMLMRELDSDDSAYRGAIIVLIAKAGNTAIEPLISYATKRETAKARAFAVIAFGELLA